MMENNVMAILAHEVDDIVVSEMRRKWKGIVFHHSAYTGEKDQGTIINRWHKDKGWKGIGYHFVVNRSGVIEATFRWWRQLSGAHCKGYNSDYVGICLAGNFEMQFPTQNQVGNFKRLLSALGLVIGIPHFLLHNTLCPGKNFPYNEAYEILNYSKIKRRYR